jgi:hypothetical protein
MGLAPLCSGLSPDAFGIACSPKGLTERVLIPSIHPLLAK